MPAPITDAAQAFHRAALRRCIEAYGVGILCRPDGALDRIIDPPTPMTRQGP